MKKGLLLLFSLALIGTFASFPSVASALADPCATATVIVDVVNIFENNPLSSQENLTEVASYDLESGGTTIGHGISKYTSQSFGALTYVASEETVILEALSLTVFGQSSNTVDGIAGARGIITGAITFDGQKETTLRGNTFFPILSGFCKSAFFWRLNNIF